MTRNIRLSVRDYMATDIVVALQTMGVHEALDLMILHRISSLLVIDDREHLAGILSGREALRAAFRATYYQQPGGSLADFIKRDLEFLSPDDDIAGAAARLLNSRHRSFPVVEEGRLIGILGRRHVLRAVRDLW